LSLVNFINKMEDNQVTRFAERVIKGKKTVFDRLARM